MFTRDNGPKSVATQAMWSQFIIMMQTRNYSTKTCVSQYDSKNIFKTREKKHRPVRFVLMYHIADLSPRSEDL